MLVIISDLHLSDGTVGGTTPPGAFRVFAQRLRELAVAASWRAEGAYSPIGRIDLVLLGDVLDVIGSARWASRSDVRPWGDPYAPKFVDQVARVTADILTHNQDSLAVLRGLTAEGGVSVPPSLRSAKPASDTKGQPVPVRVHYMVGNRDWFYHLPGPDYDALRGCLVEQMGLANRPDRPFPHDFEENDELLQAMRRHKVAARHGDLFDPLNFEGHRDAASLGDVIVIELANRFAAEVEAGLGDELPASTVLRLREIENIRPLMLIPVWIDGLLEQTCTLPAMRNRVKTLWDRLADELLEIDFVRQHGTSSPFDLVGGLERVLKFGKRRSKDWAGAIVEWLQKIRGCPDASYYHHALTEQDFRNRRAKHIVYGHTHLAETVPLDASYAERYVHDQVYFNSGTWRRVHRQTRLAPGQHEFIASDVMTYLAFFQGDERMGRPYETWCGALGHHSTEITVHRIDLGKARHVAGQSVAAPGRPSQPPHFATPSIEPNITPTRRT